jgi:alpha-L-fucosidase 2
VLARETERLHGLVEHLLNFGRMEAGKTEYRFEPADAGALVESVAAGFRAELAAIRSRLAPNQVGRHGQLQEWLEDYEEPES